MDDRKEFGSRKLALFVCGLAIWAAMTAIWAYVWYEFYAEAIPFTFYRRGHWMVIALYGIILFLITQFYGGYRVGYYRRGDVIFSSIMSMLLTHMITYFQTSVINRDWASIRPIALMSLVDFALIWLWATVSYNLYIRLNPPRQLLMVYGGSMMAQELVVKMADRHDRYMIQEVIQVEEGMDTVLERVEQFGAVLICDVKSEDRNRILKYCYDRSIRVYMTPKISDILIRGAAKIHLFDSPLLLSRNNGLSAEQRAFKRILDLALAVLGLVVGSPFMLLVAIAIKLEDGGPVFYTQTRLTRGGKEFTLYKFRSMIVDAEKKRGAQLSTLEDCRITRVGRVIRAIRFDELPQFWNILIGDMSFVGPRPERPELARKYQKTMMEFDFRLKVKAGLTGYAQVQGKYNTTPYDKLKLDLMYISEYSFLMDIQIILQTIKTLFMRESAEGVAEEDSGEFGESLLKKTD